jgi:hypothetical protein
MDIKEHNNMYEVFKFIAIVSAISFCATIDIALIYLMYVAAIVDDPKMDEDGSRWMWITGLSILTTMVICAEGVVGMLVSAGMAAIAR